MKKKIILFSLLASLIVGMTACNNENSVQEITEQVTSVSETTAKKQAEATNRSETKHEKTETTDHSETNLTVNNETQITAVEENVTEFVTTGLKEENKDIFSDFSLSIDGDEYFFPVSLENLGFNYSYSDDYVEYKSEKDKINKIAKILFYKDIVIGTVIYYNVPHEKIQKNTEINSIMINNFSCINSLNVNNLNFIKNYKTVIRIDDIYKEFGMPSEKYDDVSFSYKNSDGKKLDLFFEKNDLKSISIKYNGGN